jgi:hypothetical protein
MAREGKMWPPVPPPAKRMVGEEFKVVRLSGVQSPKSKVQSPDALKRQNRDQIEKG